MRDGSIPGREEGRRPAVLGHEDEDVTDRYIDVPLSEQLAAVNRAALLIDGDAAQNVVPIRRKRSKMARAAGA